LAGLPEGSARIAGGPDAEVALDGFLASAAEGWPAVRIHAEGFLHHVGRHLRLSPGKDLQETGLIVTEENRRLIPDVDLREFEAKVREYYDLATRAGRRRRTRLPPTSRPPRPARAGR
jgi:hypothetical protein